MSRDRLFELLADRATQGLSDAESRELDALLSQHPDVEADVMDRAAAAVDLAFDAGRSTMPAAVHTRIAAAIPGASKPPRIEPVAVISRLRPAAYLGWLVAAACLILALLAWWPPRAPRLAPAADRQALIAKAGTIRADWGEWSDSSVAAEIKGVQGDIVWNEAEQRGYMTFTGLPPIDPARQTYQLWIIDDRGMNQRISGGTFDAATGPIPITPAIRTRNAAAFAVTIEEPGGVAVSDMKRRVVIAAKKG